MMNAVVVVTDRPLDLSTLSHFEIKEICAGR